MKPDCQRRVPILDYVSLHTEVREWNESHVVFNELGMPRGERTETFFAAFPSCWLWLFILLVRDAGCIRPKSFSVPSSMEGGQTYSLLRPSLRAFIEVW